MLVMKKNLRDVGWTRTTIVQGQSPYHLTDWKYDILIYFCRHGALPPIWKPCLPTDFAFRSSRASNAPLRTIKIHRGRLSATSPAHHRMAINHLLHRLDMMCFLALGATSYLTKCENLRSDTIPDFFIGLCCVRVWLILKESVVAPICPLHWKGSP